MIRISPDDFLVESRGSLELYRLESGYMLVRPWRGARHVVAGLVGVALVVIALRTMIWHHPMPLPKNPPAPIVLLGSTVFFYYMLAGLVNQTRIQVGPSSTRIWRGPLPALGGRIRMLPPIREVRFGASQAGGGRGAMLKTWVLEGSIAGHWVVLDLSWDRERAEDMLKLLKRALAGA